MTPERYFCERCGKRVGGGEWDIHTCTPPADVSLTSEGKKHGPTDEQAEAAFNEFAAKYDTFSDRWQDMASNEYFTAGYKAGWKAAKGQP
jgi:hypothetical protein